MTEEEWMVATDPNLMLELLKQKGSDRKWRLFGVSCCRRIEPLFLLNETRDNYQEGGRLAILTTERYADGQATDEELYNACDEAEFCGGSEYNPFRYLAMTNRDDLLQVASLTLNELAGWEQLRLCNPDDPDHMTHEAHAEYSFTLNQERIAQAYLVRDIFGNPFHKVKFDKKWRTDTAILLARTMYEARDFGAMPILADALQDAGCDSEDILNHCRDANATHVRGCWVVDLVLGKK